MMHGRWLFPSIILIFVSDELYFYQIAAVYYGELYSEFR